MINLSNPNDKVNDQMGTPTSTVNVARVIMKLIQDKDYRLFHCTCKGECTWYELTKETSRLKCINTVVLPCLQRNFQGQLKRPRFSVRVIRPCEHTKRDLLNAI